MVDPVFHKIRRLRQGNGLRVIDVFAGCGGLSLGFHAAGYDLLGAVESDSTAASSYAHNFHREEDASIRALHSKARDICETEPADLAEELGLGRVDRCVDVIVGGPPCQAFARVGRAKLREVAEHPAAFRQDERGNLYLRYLHYVQKFQPLALLMENVPDVLNYGGHNVAEEIAEVLNDQGYVCKYTLLNAAFYGVPQMRERMFLLAYRRELACEVQFPSPTHWVDLPRGYEGTRRVALRTLGVSRELPFFASSFLPAPTASPKLQKAITAEEALRDLPEITCHLEGKLRRGARRFDSVICYPNRHELSSYARLMRHWPGFENKIGVSDHVIRFLPRDYEIFRRMSPGDQYPEAYQVALQLLRERIRLARRRGERLVEGSSQYQRLLAETVPPYDPGKFPNKWRKMEADAPSRTLLAHLGKDSYSHIHYDSEQARTISVREAARLQSFPDGFTFHGTMNPAFRQIGNAVPPLLANAIANQMLRTLGIRPQVSPLNTRLRDSSKKKQQACS